MLPPMPDQSDGGSGGGGANGGVGEENPLIRWRKGELIGAGAFGQVYLGMNLDSGELLAVKQVGAGGFGARDH
jgi:serine/threonine protein kinase